MAEIGDTSVIGAAIRNRASRHGVSFSDREAVAVAVGAIAMIG